jgi:hypothetical protein
LSGQNFKIRYFETAPPIQKGSGKTVASRVWTASIETAINETGRKYYYEKLQHLVRGLPLVRGLRFFPK